uniref:Uncharacterized protein n=1 Tax=Salvator merianae TaxID=96440 RepID=A0A8D0E1J1_SALMN
MTFTGPNLLPKGVLSTIRHIDYSQWQREDLTRKQAVTISLPAVLPSKEWKEEGNKRSLQKLIFKNPVQKERGRPSRIDVKMTASTRQKLTGQEAASRDMMAAKSAENIKIMQQLCKSKGKSLEELKRHSSFLLAKNQDLMEEIKRIDAGTSVQARMLLQQYDLFRTIIARLQDSSQNQVGVARADLEATEKMVEKNMGKLESEAKRMSTKLHTLQEELNVLRTYMDKEYPGKAVQISSLLRRVRNLNEEQEDELGFIEDLSKWFRNQINQRVLKKQNNILHAATEKQLMPYQDGLHQMNLNNLELRRQIEAQKEIIGGLVEEIKGLHRSIIRLHHTLRDPREVIFADVLLRRPKCTPDMEVVLNIPTDEDFYL